jgi:hypothetical protein
MRDTSTPHRRPSMIPARPERSGGDGIVSRAACAGSALGAVVRYGNVSPAPLAGYARPAFPVGFIGLVMAGAGLVPAGELLLLLVAPWLLVVGTLWVARESARPFPSKCRRGRLLRGGLG